VTVSAAWRAKARLGEHPVDPAEERPEQQQPIAGERRPPPTPVEPVLGQDHDDPREGQHQPGDLARGQPLPPGRPRQHGAPERDGGEHERAARGLGEPQPDVEGEREGGEGDRPEQREEGQVAPGDPQQAAGPDGQAQEERAAPQPEAQHGQAERRHVAHHHARRHHRGAEDDQGHGQGRVGGQRLVPHRGPGVPSA
jgi:hypothetical protein